MFFLEEKVSISKNPLRLFPLIRHGFAVPPSPQGEGFGAAGSS